MVVTPPTVLTPGPAQRVAVIGDIGGHADELRTELRRLGAADDAHGTLPPDLVVVQVGDLIHRGPDSEGVLDVVGGYLSRQPGQWIQLIGNHESLYVGSTTFAWKDRLGRRSARQLREWWLNGALRAAVEIRLDDESLLVTHAGVTEGFWRHMLNSAPTAADAVRRLNELLGHGESFLYRGGRMLSGGEPDLAAGPLWALAGSELVESWRGRELPFSQVHGHNAVTDWESGTVNLDPALAARTTIDREARHETVSLNGGRIVGVDPCHLTDAGASWRAWVLGGTGPA